MNEHLQSLVKALSEELRREQLIHAGHSSEVKQGALRKLLASRLSAADPEDRYHILAMVKKHFPHRVHERDLELNRYKMQLSVLAEKNRELQAKLAESSLKPASIGFLMNLITATPKRILINQDQQKDDDAFLKRLSDSLEKIITFVKELEENCTAILKLSGLPVPKSDLFQILRDRLSEQVDPGSEPLDAYLAKLKQRMFSLLEVQQETVTAGVTKLLNELDPEKLGRVKDKTNVRIGPVSLSHRRDKWTVFEKAFTALRKTPPNKLYRTYFEGYFKQALLEREKNGNKQTKK